MTGAVATGSKVVYQDGIYTVRAVDGAVLELAYHTGRFFGWCISPASSRALPISTAGQKGER